MANRSALRVAKPPPRPILIWDGDCHFCRLWIERWRTITAGEIDFAPSQEAATRFPDIAREEFDRAVVYINTAGEVFTGAEAIHRSLRCRPSRKWLAWSYDHVPGFAGISELFYRVIARNRRLSSSATRLLWGNDVRPPTYGWARRSFLRVLGIVYLSAFLSLWIQIDGLIGRNGILPVGDFFSGARAQLGWHAYSLLPSLCWFNASDGFLHLLCGSGILLSVLLILGFVPILCLILLFISYLSLTVAGQDFLSFQWDILLLESGFLAIFLAPAELWLTARCKRPASRIGLFLLKLLLFKLMFMSGVVKLTSHDECWWNLSALDFHYWSQPLPTVFAWWADKHPEWFKEFSVGFCLVVEIIVPFFIWAPRRLRLLAAGLLISLQIAIALTGNYCFFNLLTITLCLLLIDDASLPRWRWHRVKMEGRAPASPLTPASQERRPPTHWISASARLLPVAVVLVITLPLNAWQIFTALKPDAECPSAISLVSERVDPFRIANGYGLFRVMTKDRREIVIEGSADGMDWRAYEFKWKPGDVTRAPGWCAPHQPRLDWQMWFAALSSAQQNRWFLQLIGCLLENKRDVTQLLANNPFPENGPRYIRARFYRYRFTSTPERRQTGAWWRREELGEYLPTVSLK